MTLFKHQFVTYRALEGAGPKVGAIIRRVHKDGTATVQARFSINDDGTENIHAGFLGYHYRIAQSRLTPGAI